MIPDWAQRTVMLFGESGFARLQQATVVVVGCGGVGSAAAEMVARSGVGSIVLVDSDTVSVSNINRQLPALHSTVGKSKVDVVMERILDINPEVSVSVICDYVTEQNVAELFSGIPLENLFVIDAIDTLSPKIALIQFCLEQKIPMVSSMGAGAKVDATAIRVADISGTYQCPLAHMLRKRLHKLGITSGFKAVFSVEEPRRESITLEESRNKKSQVGTVSYLPVVFGCVCAQTAVTHIVGLE